MSVRLKDERGDKIMKKLRFGWPLYYLRCSAFQCTPRPKTMVEDRKPGGWKTMPYIIGNETFEKLATLGLLANFMVYLLHQYNLKPVVATNFVNIWFGTTNFAPLLGAFLSDAYFGRYRTLAFASVASFLGMTTMTITASVPQLRPPSCEGHANCVGPSMGQLGVLMLALVFLTMGAGGIRPCNLAFGVDQFDPTTEAGKKGIDSFFNWYYFTFTVSVMIAVTLVVYIQDSVSWAIGLGIPTFLMLCSILLFFMGSRLYVYVQPGGSVFTGFIQVFVAAFKKRKLTLPPNPHEVLYDPVPDKASPVISKLPLTDQFSFLNKAAIQEEDNVKPGGTPVNPWRLCGVQTIEEVKCLIRIAPIWVSGIICFMAVVQQNTFTLLQAIKMDRHLGPHFQIPPGSLTVISMLALTLWLPFYDRIVVPAASKITGRDGGVTLLQRIGIGLVISILSMVVAGFVEEKRRKSAVSHGGINGVAPISVMWLAPQLLLMGLAEAFNAIGQIEFYYKQFPEHMKSVAGSLFCCVLAGSSYLSSLMVTVVHRTTGKHGHPKWLDSDLNNSKLDYFYFTIAALGVLNLLYFIICANGYHYKADLKYADIEDGKVTVQLN